MKKGLTNGNGARYYYVGNEKIGYYKDSLINNNKIEKGEIYNYSDKRIYKGIWENDKGKGKDKLN